jgi:hypothetical protein
LHSPPAEDALMNDQLPQEIWDHEIMAIEEPAVDWLWHGFLAPGNVTG